MKYVKNIFVLFMQFAGFAVYSQEAPLTLSLDEVMAIVKKYHPVAKQAYNNVEQMKAGLTAARGSFDPVLQHNYTKKTFDNIQYYTYKRSELVIPTWFGIELHSGLEYLDGSRTAPEETSGRTSYFGISIPLAKNLLMDKRRAALQSAKIYAEASETEKRKILNDLLYEAATAYWNWVMYHRNLKTIHDVVTINQERLQLTKTAYDLGDRPAIDTTEALNQLQSFGLLELQASLAFQNAGLELSLFLWREDNTPYFLPQAVTPADNLLIQSSEEQVPDLGSLLEVAQRAHPELILYDYKLDALEINRRLKFQDLLPKVDLKYNQLGKGYNIPKAAINPLLENNFQYGISVAVPLRVSYGRGEYRLAKIKILNTALQRSQKQWQVQNKIISGYNELLLLRQQVALQQKTYENFSQLLRAEVTRYRNGESSLFLINNRETKALEAMQKLQELQARYQKTKIALEWAAGVLGM